jgi:hypothetical protein
MSQPGLSHGVNVLVAPALSCKLQHVRTKVLLNAIPTAVTAGTKLRPRLIKIPHKVQLEPQSTHSSLICCPATSLSAFCTRHRYMPQ